MTTVDVTIRRIDPVRGTNYIGGPGYLSRHGGWFGAAVEILHVLVREFTAGELTGPWHSSHIQVTVPGSTLRAILAGLSREKAEAPQAGHQEGVWDQIAAYRDSISDSADYAIDALEV